MARALLGYVGNSSDQLLVMEVARLRRRVTELEAELEALRAADHAVMDIELHQIAEVGASALA